MLRRAVVCGNEEWFSANDFDFRPYNLVVCCRAWWVNYNPGRTGILHHPKCPCVATTWSKLLNQVCAGGGGDKRPRVKRKARWPGAKRQGVNGLSEWLSCHQLLSTILNATKTTDTEIKSWLPGKCSPLSRYALQVKIFSASLNSLPQKTHNLAL